MAIKITQFEKKWRVEIVQEIFQFENVKDTQKFLNDLLVIKDKKGDIRNG